MDLHLIGTVHTDPQGEERLWKALEYLQPDVITVESDQEMFNDTHIYVKALFNKLKIQNQSFLARESIDVSLGSLEHYLLSEPCFEVNTCKRFGIQKNVPVIPVDHNIYVSIFGGHQRILSNLEYQYRGSIFAGSHNVERSIDSMLHQSKKSRNPEAVSRAYQKTIQYVSGCAVFSENEVEAMRTYILHPERESMCAESIKRVLRGTTVHVCGLGHLVRDSRLKSIRFRLEQNLKLETHYLCNF